MASSVARWVLRISAAGAVGAAVVSGVYATQAQAAPHRGGTFPVSAAASRSADTDHRRVVPLDGFLLTYLPDGVGAASDFDYEWAGVRFHTRDWESRVGEGWRVDLTAQTLRGQRLADLTALQDFLTDYEQKDPDAWRLRPFHNGAHPGLICDDQAFWLVQPGVAVSIRIDRDRFSHADLVRTARSIRLL